MRTEQPTRDVFRPKHGTGKLAREAGYRLPLTVLKSAAGHYIGTANDEGPVSRESLEYFSSSQEALNALETDGWSQRDSL